MASGSGVIQAELSIELGQFLAALNQAQAALAKYAQGAGSSMVAANQAYTKSNERAAESTKSLTKTLSDWKGEQVQQARQAKYLASTITEIIPASDGAKSALAGLISVGLEGAAGGFGFGLALEVVTLIGSQIQRIVGETEAAKKKATEWGVEMRKELISMTDKARDLADEMANVTPTQKAQRVTVDTGAAVERLAAEEASIRARMARMMAESGKPNPSKEFTEYVGDASIFSTSQAEQDRIRLKAIEEGIADSRTKSLSVLRAEAKAAKEVADLTEKKAAAALRVAIAESKAAGNLDYEMAGGDGGAALATQAIDRVRTGFVRAGADAEAAIAKVRGASQEELERLRLKGELVTLNAQLTAATTQAEIEATRRRIQAAKEESAERLRNLPRFGPGNAAGEGAFTSEDKAAREKARSLEFTGPSAASDAYEMPEAFGDAGLRAKASAEELKKLTGGAEAARAAFSQLGDGIGSAFSSIGSAIGGAAGEFIAQVGAMISQTIALVLALAFSDTLMTGPLGVFAAIPMGAAILASLIGMIASVPSFDVGTLSVPRTGLAMVHAGEAILPADGTAQAYRSGGRGTRIVNMTIHAFDGPSVYRTLIGNRREVERAFREMERDS